MQRRSFTAALASLPLAACTRSDRDSAETVLRFAWWGGAGRHEATLKAIAAFERQNPGLKIKAEYMGFNGYLERLTTQIAGGSEPDIMQINWAWLAMFSKRGSGFADLQQYGRHIALDQFSAEDLDQGRVEGKLNALPSAFTARVFLWNQAAFQRAGLPLPKTWDDLFTAGRVFKEKLGDQAYPLDGELYDMILMSQTWVQQKYGTPYVDPKTPRVAMSREAALDWVRFYRRLIAEHVATPLPLRASLGGADKPTEQQQDWVVGNWAGNFTWDSTIPLRNATLDKNQKLVLGDFLVQPGAQGSGMFGRPTVMLTMGRHCKHPEIAARFINFLLTDPEAIQLLGKTRGVPAARQQFETLERAKKLPALELQAHQQIKQLRDAGQVPVPAKLFEHARLHKFMREVFETVAYGKTTDEEAARRLVEEGNALLKRIK